MQLECQQGLKQYEFVLSLGSAGAVALESLGLAHIRHCHLLVCGMSQVM